MAKNVHQNISSSPDDKRHQKLLQPKIKNPVHKGLIYRAFANDLIEQANTIVSLPTSHAIKQTFLEKEKRQTQEAKEYVSEKDAANISFLFNTLQDTYLTNDIKKYIGLLKDFFSQYTATQVAKVIGPTKLCQLLIWQGQYFVEKAQSDTSYVEKLKLLINTLSGYADLIEKSPTFLFYFLHMKIHYQLSKGHYQEVLDGLYYGMDSQILRLSDLDQQVFIADAKITALNGLKKYDEALALIKETFVSLANYITDHPDMMKIFTGWERDILYTKSEFLFKAKEYKKVLQSLANLLQKYPNHVEGKKLLSSVFSILKIKEVDELHSLEELLIAGKLFYAIADYDRAREYFMAAIDIDPNNEEAIEYINKKLPIPKGPKVK